MKKKLLSTLAAVSMLTNLVTPVLAAPVSHEGNGHYSYATGYEGNVTEAKFLESEYTIQNGSSKNLLDELMAFVDDSLLAHELRHVEWFIENHDSNYPMTLDNNTNGLVNCGFDSGTATLKAVITRTDGKIVTASTTLRATPKTISYATGFSMDTSLTLRTGPEAIFDETITIKPTGDSAIFSKAQADAIIDAINNGNDLDVSLRQGYNIAFSSGYEVNAVASYGSSASWNGYSGYETVEVTYEVGTVNKAVGDFTKGYVNVDVTELNDNNADVEVKDGYWVTSSNTNKQFYVGGVAIKATNSLEWGGYDLLKDIQTSLNSSNNYSAAIKDTKDASGTDAKVLEITMNTKEADQVDDIMENLAYANGGSDLDQAPSYQEYSISNLDDAFDLADGTAVTIEAKGTSDQASDLSDINDLSKFITAFNSRLTDDTDSDVEAVLWDKEENAPAVSGTEADDIVLRLYDKNLDSEDNTVPNLSAINGNTVTVSENSGDDEVEMKLSTTSNRAIWAVNSNWVLDGAAEDGTGDHGSLINYTETVATTAYDYILSVDNFPRYSKNVQTDVIDDVARSIRIDSKLAIQPTSLHQTSAITVAVGDMVDLEQHFKVNSTTNSHHALVFNEAYFNNDASYGYNDFGVITSGNKILGVREGKNKVVASVYNSYTNKTYYAEIVVTVVPATGISTTVTPTLNPLKVTAAQSTITLGGAGTTLKVENYGEGNILDSIFPTLQSDDNFKIEDHLEYTSSNPAVLSVDGSGNVTAIGVGSATVTVKVPNSDYEATTTITVVAPVIPNTDSGSTGGSTSVPATGVNALAQLF